MADDDGFQFPFLFNSLTEAVSPDSTGEFEGVFEMGEEGCIRFKVDMGILGNVVGEFSVDFAHTLFSAWAFYVLACVYKMESFADTPFCNAGLRIHPRINERVEGEIEKLVYGFVHEALVKGLRVMLARMKLLPWRALSEAIISIVLDMEENKIVQMDGTRADIWKAQVDKTATSLLREMSVGSAVRSRSWTRPLRHEAMSLYEHTSEVLRDLKNTYFGCHAKRIRRQDPNWIPWKDAKARHPELAGLLKRLPGHSVRELALSHVSKALGIRGNPYIYQQISKARAERRQMQFGLESVIHQIVEKKMQAFRTQLDIDQNSHRSR